VTDALDILHREHRAITAVLHCFGHIIEETKDRKLAPEFDFFDAVIRYMREFPDQMHHPKEDEFLFKTLRAKAPEMAPVLDELHEQHVEGDRMLSKLHWKLMDWRKTPDDDAIGADFCAMAEAFIEFQWQHAAQEERTVMPEARKCLDAEDWAPINAAFMDNDDPLFGSRTQDEFGKLFSRVVALAPQPWGLAERHAPPTTNAGALDPDHQNWDEAQRRNILALKWV
jgi:branched-chain amino acid transport system ATP-binding protein